MSLFTVAIILNEWVKGLTAATSRSKSSRQPSCKVSHATKAIAVDEFME